jgi:FkbM family methyltransferase
MRFKNAVKKIFPNRDFQINLKYASFILQNARNKNYNYEGVTLKLPRNHSLPRIEETDRFNNMLLKVASSICFTEEEFVYLDIGANVGDTAAIVYNQAIVTPKMILVEPSPFYFRYLKINAEKFRNTTLVRKYISLFSPPRDIQGKLLHWGGTARIERSERNYIPIVDQIHLETLINLKTRLIKVDTDGYDVKIIGTILDELLLAITLIYFENEIQTVESLNECKQLLLSLQAVGYKFFIVVKNDGELITSGRLDEQVLDVILETQFRDRKVLKEAGFYYSELLLLKAADFDVFNQIVGRMKKQQKRNAN